MGTRYHVKTATMQFGTNTWEMATGPSAKGQTREATEVTSLADVFKQFIPGALIEDDEITVTIYDKGNSSRITVKDAPAALSFAVALSNGEDQDVTADFSYVKAIVTKVSPPSQEGSGDRKATIDVTFRPNGEQPPEGTSGTSGTTGTTGTSGTGGN